MKKVLEDAPLYIGGWLILLGLRIFGGIAINGNSISQSISLDLGVLGQIIRILLILFILYIFVVLCLFIKRHKAFPITYIVSEALSIVLNISTFFVFYKPGTTEREEFLIIYTVVLVLISVLWILYVLLSERVKKTFVLKWNETVDQRLADRANRMEANR